MGFKKGFTLVEFLIAFAIVGAVGVLAAAVYVTHYKLFSKQTSLIDVATQNKLALDDMVSTIRQSDSLVAGCCSGTETTTSQELVLQFWPLNASGDPQDPAPDYDYIIYKKDPIDTTKLLKKIVPASGSSRTASTKIIAVNIGTNSGDLSFNYGADPATAASVDISLTTSQTGLSATQTSTHTATAFLRNK